VADRHRGDDLLRVEEDRQRALDDHCGLDLLAGLIDAGDALGQPRVERVRLDQIAVFLLAGGHDGPTYHTRYLGTKRPARSHALSSVSPPPACRTAARLRPWSSAC